MSDEILSESEIAARYPDQFVLIDVLEFDSDWSVKRGIVRGHGDDKDALHQAARQLPEPRQISVLYTGKDDQIYLLNYGLFL